jgi:bifunctional DNA-binding transcriptional regulator/antitoxin component of YhaV-PrlF toxin-antitoxin module
MIRVKISDQSYLHIPESLSKQLDLAEDDRVEVVRSGHLIALRKLRTVSPPKPLRHLAGLVKSSRPKASVDVAKYMTHRGYESLHGQQDSQVR